SVWGAQLATAPHRRDVARSARRQGRGPLGLSNALHLHVPAGRRPTSSCRGRIAGSGRTGGIGTQRLKPLMVRTLGSTAPTGGLRACGTVLPQDRLPEES